MPVLIISMRSNFL